MSLFPAALPGRRTAYALFFVSGFTALVFEVVWAKQACLIFGNTTFASACVIGAFLTGLAIGSHAAGRRADGVSPARALGLYGLLEIGVGAYALAYPYLCRLLSPAYRDAYNGLFQDHLQLSFVRFLLSFLLLVVPTVLMGATFPMLARFVDRGALEKDGAVGRLYAMNLTGAACGAFASGYILIAALGLGGTSGLAAGMNLLIGFYAWHSSRCAVPAGRGEPAAPPQTPAAAPAPRTDAAWVAFLLAAHGFSAFVVQIVWMRVMALILGSSTYSFSAVLVTFLAGLGLGTFAVGRAVRARIEATLTRLGWLEMAAGFSVIAFIPTYEWLIYAYLRLADGIQGSVATVFLAQFLFSAAGMIVPCFLIGLVFPASMYALGDERRLGRWLGTIYAVNTLGGVLGSALGAFVLIRWLGLQGTLAAAGFVSLLAGAAVVVLGPDRPDRFRNRAARALGALLVSAVLALYPWDPNLFGAGAFLYSDTWADEARLGKHVLQQSMKATHRILFYRDGISSTVTVFQQGSGRLQVKSLRVNGKTDASTVGDMDTQLYLGYLPMFAHPEPKRVLVIGLGAGITLKAVSQFREARSIDCVEIEPAVVEANRFFSAENNHVLKDKRVRVIIGDGRNHLQFSRASYDVIVSEPSNPWVSGVSSLFTRENYEAALDRLSPDGVFCQWFHAYQMSTDDFVMIIRTFAAVFPQVNLYRVSTGDFMLLGSRQPIAFDQARVRNVVKSDSEMNSDLRFFSRHGPHFVIGAFLLSDRDLRRALETRRPPLLNTDDRLRLEYSAPMHLYESTTGQINAWLYGLERRDWYPALTGEKLEDVLSDPTLAPTLVRNGMISLMGGDSAAAVEYLGRARAISPESPEIRFGLGRAHERAGRYAEAKPLFESLLGLPDWEQRAKTSLSRIKIKQDMEINPILKRDVRAHNLLAGLTFISGDMIETEERMKQAIEVDPSFGKNYSDFSSYYLLKDFLWDGKRMLDLARRYDDPSSPALLRAERLWSLANVRADAARRVIAGKSYFEAGLYERAAKSLEEAVRLNPNSLPAHALLARTAARLGQEERARKHLAEAERLRAASTGPPAAAEAPAAPEESAAAAAS